MTPQTNSTKIYVDTMYKKPWYKLWSIQKCRVNNASKCVKTFKVYVHILLYCTYLQPMKIVITAKIYTNLKKFLSYTNKH